MPAPNSRYSLDGVWESGIASAVGYLLGGSVLVLIGVNGADLVPPLPGAPGWAWVPVLLLGCIGLVFRRRSVPVMLAVTGTAVVASMLLGGGIITYLLLFELFYAGILFGSPQVSRAAQTAAVAGVVILPVVSGLSYGGWPAAFFGLLQAVLICLIPLWWAGSVRRQSDRAEQERQRAETERLRAERTEELAELNLRVAVAAERSAMARELHDAIAGHLSAVALQSAAALAAGNPDLDRRVLAQVRTESVQALREMRSMIDLLEADDGPDAVPLDTASGGLDQLAALAGSARLAGNPVDLDMEPGLEVPVLVGSTCYRIVQEALSNAVRHAPGRPVTIRVREAENLLDISIRNALPRESVPQDGVPAAAAGVDPCRSGNGSGLRNMSLRAGALQGSFSAGIADAGEDGAEWLVQALLPVGSPADRPLTQEIH
ncbi:histidine kinase [Arthrobacter gengyunqii]|uniref:histidine kinase n=1 Tax=Arthrobacter gengyunqii TaxID=2886940 RepID=A0A9X1M0S6_9MICC|nr:histidine kinase [Arthrobacter gengyunqii]MCC3269106.1 histidine kinase [Arthrobacter gengyunqii]UOY94928.1 histidine kinase [Arthrobacter gengyunqii]